MGKCIYKVEKINIKSDMEKVVSLIKDKKDCIVLDGQNGGNCYSQHSIILFEPFLVFKSKGENIEVIGEEKQSFKGKPLDYLQRLLNSYRMEKVSAEIPFTFGCAGFFAYDLCNTLETLPKNAADKYPDIPDIYMAFYNSSIVFKHNKNEVYLSASSIGMKDTAGLPEKVDNRQKELKEMIIRADKAVRGNQGYNYEMWKSEILDENENLPLKSNFTKDSYCKTIKKAKEYIRNGDIFQVNISQRFKKKIDTDPYDIYLKLRSVNPAPFSAYLSLDDYKVLCCSPERFLKLSERIVETRPIKGTRPRGKTAEADNLLKNELYNSEKDRAEHIMIVDVHRNDLGKVCKAGTVKVERKFEIEEYATVLHMVSTITGELMDDKDIIDCIKAAFPGGSITGAPKIRSMEIIDELERVKRNIYTGSIGYIGFNGDADLNIAIRTIVVNGGEACFNVGGGIVWDSIPESEYDETIHKGEALIKVLSGEVQCE